MKSYMKIFGAVTMAAMAMALVACGASGGTEESKADEKAQSELKVEATKEDMEYEESETTTTVTTTSTTSASTETTTAETTTETTEARPSGSNQSGGAINDRVHRDDASEIDYEFQNTYSPVSSFAIDEKWCNMAVAGVDLNIDSIIEKYGLVAIEGKEAEYSGGFNEMGFSGGGYYTYTHPATSKTNTDSTKAYFMTNDAGEVVAAAFKDLSTIGQVSVGDANDMRISYVDGLDNSTLPFVFGDESYTYQFENGLNALVYSDGYFSTIFIMGNEEGLSPEEVSEILVINNNYLTVKEDVQ